MVYPSKLTELARSHFVRPETQGFSLKVEPIVHCITQEGSEDSPPLSFSLEMEKRSPMLPSQFYRVTLGRFITCLEPQFLYL